MTAALDAIARIDDGTASPADRELAEVFDRHSSDRWAAMDLQLLRFAAAVCAICGGEVVRVDEVVECDRCTGRWDALVDRSVDL